MPLAQSPRPDKHRRYQPVDRTPSNFIPYQVSQASPATCYQPKECDSGGDWLYGSIVILCSIWFSCQNCIPFQGVRSALHSLHLLPPELSFDLRRSIAHFSSCWGVRKSQSVWKYDGESKLHSKFCHRDTFACISINHSGAMNMCSNYPMSQCLVYQNQLHHIFDALSLRGSHYVSAVFESQILAQNFF